MTLEIITFDEHGQGTVDFEALEMITSLEFVEELKSQLDFGFEIFYFENLTYSATIYLKRETTVLLLTLFRESKIIQKSFLSKIDLEISAQILGGTLSWEK